MRSMIVILAIGFLLLILVISWSWRKTQKPPPGAKRRGTLQDHVRWLESDNDEHMVRMASLERAVRRANLPATYVRYEFL